jgi:Xaa-Pro aminopeptidase
MERDGLDALVAYSVGNQPGPVAYLAGYEPRFGLSDVAFFVLVPGEQPRYALLAHAYWDSPQERTWTDDVLVMRHPGTRLAEFLPPSIKRLGIAGFRFFPAPVYADLRAALPSARIEDATALLMDLAKVKSPREIEVMRRCTRITDAGGRAFLAGVREGAVEREIQIEIERAMLLEGADGLAFPTLLFTGPDVAVGIGFSSNRALEAGEQVNVVCGALHYGYRNDLGRVTTVGRPSHEVQAIMETAAQMQDAMLGTVRAGVPIAAVAQAAATVVRGRGMESYSYKSPNNTATYAGHGIGCWLDEPPQIQTTEPGILEENMVLVLEARLGKPGAGGATITDPVVVTAGGAERLSHLDIRTWPT